MRAAPNPLSFPSPFTVSTVPTSCETGLGVIGLVARDFFAHEMPGKSPEFHPTLSRSLCPRSTPFAERDFADYLLRMTRSMGPKIAQLIPSIPADGIVYDIGSGSGDQSYAYARLFPRSFVVGVDLAPQSIEHARERFSAANLVFLMGNAVKGFAPKNSANAVIDSSVAHELFSFTGYSRENLSAYFKQVTDALLPGGSYASRDFTSPFWPEKVRLRLPTAPENGEGAYGKHSRAELFAIYARDLRTKDFPDGVEYVEIPTGDAKWREFETDGIAAANFILRMEYRRNWVPELKEQYLYWNLFERIAALEAAGLRVDYASEVHNTWIYLNWWKDRLSVADAAGEPVDLPPTNMILAAVKPGPDDPRSLEITAVAKRPGTASFPLLSYADRNSGAIWDTVHVEGETQQFIPYETDAAGEIYVYVKRRAEKPSLRHYARDGEIFRSHYGGYVSEAWSSVETDDDAVSATSAFAKFWREAGGNGFRELARGGAFFPTPGLSDERVTTRFVSVETADVRALDEKQLQRMELKQMIAAGNVGSVPDGRLEAAGYELARNIGAKLLPWFDGNPPITEQNIAGFVLAERYPEPERTDAFVPSESRAGFGETLILSLKRTGYDGVVTEFEREYLSPSKHSLDTFSVIPYVRAGGRILIGLETRTLPTFQARGLPPQIAVVPAWRMPRGIKSRSATTRWLKKRMASDFALETRHVTPLGEGYFPSLDTTPEKVTPFAVEVDANHPPRELTFVPLEELLGKAASIPDLHTRLAIYRLAHATDNLPTV